MTKNKKRNQTESDTQVLIAALRAENQNLKESLLTSRRGSVSTRRFSASLAETSRVAWHPIQERHVREWLLKVSLQMLFHEESFHYYRRKYLFLVIPLTILAGLTSVAGFSTWSEANFVGKDRNIAVLISSAVLFLTTVLHNLNDQVFCWKSLADQSNNSYKDHSDIATELANELNNPATQHLPYRKFLDDIETKYNAALRNASIVPNKVKQKVYQQWKDGMVAPEMQSLRTASKTTAEKAQKALENATIVEIPNEQAAGQVQHGVNVVEGYVYNKPRRVSLDGNSKTAHFLERFYDRNAEKMPTSLLVELSTGSPSNTESPAIDLKHYDSLQRCQEPTFTVEQASQMRDQYDELVKRRSNDVPIKINSFQSLPDSPPSLQGLPQIKRRKKNTKRRRQIARRQNGEINKTYRGESNIDNVMSALTVASESMIRRPSAHDRRNAAISIVSPDSSVTDDDVDTVRSGTVTFNE